MPSRNASVEELERRAEEQRERLTRDVTSLRQDVRRQLDVRRHVEEGVHTKPRTFYAAAAGTAAFAGYVLARTMKA